MARIKWLIVLTSFLLPPAALALPPAATTPPMLHFDADPMTPAGTERLVCSLVRSPPEDVLSLYRDQYVLLTYDHQGTLLPPLIHINHASKDLTFKSCAKTKVDGSNFSGWFETRCTDLASFKGPKPYTVDAYLFGAYAGISAPVQPGYGMYETLFAVGAKLGIGTPVRTFVIFANRKPTHEFFCYRQDQPIIAPESVHADDKINER